MFMSIVKFCLKYVCIDIILFLCSISFIISMVKLIKIHARKGCMCMAKIYGREYTKRELMKRVGDISQLAGARLCTLESGKAKGVTAVDVKTGGGLNFTVLPDRGMDIAWAEYKGISFGYISKTGVVAPALSELNGLEFLRSFYAGLLTTCGLTYMGAPCVDEGKPLGLHGKASNLPADDLCVSNEWVGDEFVMSIKGRMREAAVFGENITLSREITAKLGENKLLISDAIENCGYTAQPLMLLYHCNFGYPLLDGTTELILPRGTEVKASNAVALKGINECKVFGEPKHGYDEQVFYYNPLPKDDGKVTAALFNKALGTNGLSVSLTFNKNQLPYFIEWKQIGEGDYVVGLEPATWYTEGRSEARKRGELTFIEPGEIKNIELEVNVSEGLLMDI
ncbi:MAG: DUF4432 family protein [Ruminiclostridium sp.]|nr:DUF4432 family protein [Ruminiclostridium sp.]